MHRHYELAARTLTQRAAVLIGSIMCQYGLSRNCQPETCSPGLVRYVRLPHGGKIGGDDARTVVANGYLDCITTSVPSRFRLHRNRSRRSTGIDGIEQNIRKRAAERVVVSDD